MIIKNTKGFSKGSNVNKHVGFGLSLMYSASFSKEINATFIYK